ncbi:extracellular solute-binding protein [Vibrio ulleungensis]|uniref:ABC transporter substrate-binding protein n=1 Tax=Vibrio ulleungensis TaxID=2807619 RepID=A0ABS2HEZ7_9VIBR|nr:extracellular solute-binding protein [Vibrio ulleungensis]MBM7035666.1 ABC transporter substrate-binding protein [Vibrio ulleungensis]
MEMKRLTKSTLAATITLVLSSMANAAVVETTRLYTFGEPKYAEGFKHFDYVNPNAPKGGNVIYGATGTYDNFNRYSQRGNFGAGIIELYDGLMYSPSDEIDVTYGLIAQKIRYSDDFMWMEVDVHPDAKFHDGVKITANDIAFTYQKFWDQGVPFYKELYKKVKSVVALDDKTARIEMNEADKEVLFSLVQGMQVLPEHYWKDKNLSEPLSEPPLGSGAYKIGSYKSGQSITYTLVDDYWATDHPVNIGRNNFGSYTYDYYRDATVQLEAFKAGEIDLRSENISKNWATAYTGSNFDKGYIIKEELVDDTPQRMQGYVFNTEKPYLSDIRVREAITLLLDFEWMNKNLFYDQYKRTRSYFQNTEYEAKGLPSEEEIAVLTPIKDKIPERVFTDEYVMPVTDGSGRIRTQLREALQLFKAAGFEVKDGVMVNVATNEPLKLELIAYSPSTERISGSFQKNLKAAGIDLSIRMIDTTQYLKRWHERDYDLVFSSYSANPYPSSGLLQRWHSDYLDSTYNQAGVTDEAIDYLVDQIVDAQEEPEKLKVLGPALDRVLQWNYFAIPTWYSGIYRIATWDKFSRPEVMPKYDVGIDTWWIDAEKASKLPEKRR